MNELQLMLQGQQQLGGWGRLPEASLPLSPIEFPSPSFLGLPLFVFLQVYAWLQLLHQYL